jgi:N-acetylglucosamine-6-sulfatase
MNNSSFTRRRFLGNVAGAVMAAPLAKAASPRPVVSPNIRPNARPRDILFILSDDHRYDFMSFMRKPKFLRTPNMDRLAAEGAHCSNAFVNTALCSPSRASVLTGLYTHRHGVVDNNTDIPPETVFFPSLLRETGYQTAFIGKWHMGNDSDEPRPGFDKWVSFRGQGEYRDPVLNVDGERKKTRGYVTDILTDMALNWLESERDPQKPFFLMLSHKAVHAMFEPADRHAGAYAASPVEYPDTMADTEENYRGKPAWVRAQRNSWHGVDYLYHGRIGFDAFYRRYCETLLSLDESIGRVLDCLNRAGRIDETLVVYMGDNGFSLGEHGLIDKRHMYEESIRVPLLARCPAFIRPGSVVHELVQNIDIAPAFLDAAGFEPSGSMDGRSFIPLLNGEKVPWRDAVFYEYYWERNFPQTPTVHGIRTDRYKYIHYHGVWDTDEFYDLAEDPNEGKNLIGFPEHMDRITDFNHRLFDWLEASGGMLIPLRRDQGFRAIERGPG